MNQTTVKERPIIFSAPMVRAILEGRKTQTRRIVKPQPAKRLVEGLGHVTIGMNPEDDGSIWYDTDCIGPGTEVRCPYGCVGDRLWVKETWRPFVAHQCEYPGGACDCDQVYINYAADGQDVFFDDGNIPDEWGFPKTARRGNVSPLFMPRWASRFTLEITDVRVQRVQEISEADANAEGFNPGKQFGPDTIRTTSTNIFAGYWNHINGTGSWESNPWAWAISFKRIKP